MVNVNYDTGRINSIRQMGAFQIKEALKGGSLSSGEALKTLSASTKGSEDNILASVISQNFQVFANLDGNPGLSAGDMDILMLSSDVVRQTGNKSFVSASDKLHSGIVSELEKSLDMQVAPSRLAIQADAIDVINTSQGKAIFYVREGNIRVQKDKFVVNQRGVELIVEIVGKDGISSEKLVELPVPANSAFSTTIRSASVNKTGNGYQLDVYLDSMDSRVINGAKVSYSLDSSYNLVRNEEGEPTIDIATLSTVVVDRDNLGGLASLGKGKYCAIQNKGKEGLFFYALKEQLKGTNIDMVMDDQRTSVRNIKLGNVRENFSTVDLSNYSVSSAEADDNKLYVLLVSEQNKNQHFLLVVDRNQLQDSNKTMTEGFDIVMLPSDVLGLSDVRTMSVNSGRIHFFNHAENMVKDEDFGQVVSFDINKLLVK